MNKLTKIFQFSRQQPEIHDSYPDDSQQVFARQAHRFREFQIQMERGALE